MRPGFEELLRSGLLGARSFDGRLGLELEWDLRSDPSARIGECTAEMLKLGGRSNSG
ncbi:unnamed protein product [Prunus armeniaca]|uniref:Uncharacterized protein n=1 Tax=Prunus armeniaca TaxID=36596 RepID=A0A6J5Y4M6_PRUAR|nr:unnamed protein product [Prunus armeniaca]